MVLTWIRQRHILRHTYKRDLESEPNLTHTRWYRYTIMSKKQKQHINNTKIGNTAESSNVELLWVCIDFLHRVSRTSTSSIASTGLTIKLRVQILRTRQRQNATSPVRPLQESISSLVTNWWSMRAGRCCLSGSNFNTHRVIWSAFDSVLFERESQCEQYESQW